jgi:hypothetical protein
MPNEYGVPDEVMEQLDATLGEGEPLTGSLEDRRKAYRDEKRALARPTSFNALGSLDIDLDGIAAGTYEVP